MAMALKLKVGRFRGVTDVSLLRIRGNKRNGTKHGGPMLFPGVMFLCSRGVRKGNGVDRSMFRTKISYSTGAVCPS